MKSFYWTKKDADIGKLRDIIHGKNREYEV